MSRRVGAAGETGHDRQPVFRQLAAEAGRHFQRVGGRRTGADNGHGRTGERRTSAATPEYRRWIYDFPEERGIVRIVDADRLYILRGSRNQTRGLGAGAGRERVCVGIMATLRNHRFERDRLARLRSEALESGCRAGA
jgi:hypothetical protein